MRHSIRQLLFVSLVCTVSLVSVPSALAINVDQLPGNVDPTIIADVSAINTLIVQAQLDCSTNCPSWVVAKDYLQQASNKTDTLLTFLDRQAKQILPEISTLAIAKNDFDRLVLAGAGSCFSLASLGKPFKLHRDSQLFFQRLTVL